MSIGLLVGTLLMGLLAGVAAGLFGIGGGLIVVPALVLALGFDQKTATGTSLFAIMWPVGVLGVIEYWRRGELEVLPGALIAVGMLFGTLIGARMVAGISQVNMQRRYAAFLIVVSVWMIVRPGVMAKAQVRQNAAVAAEPEAPPEK